VVLSIEKRVFNFEYVFREGTRYTDLVQEQFADNLPEPPVTYRNAVRRITEKFRETVLVLNAKRSGGTSKLNHKKLMDISDSYAAECIKTIDARGHHFQQIL
jgi:hypothetical protein